MKKSEKIWLICTVLFALLVGVVSAFWVRQMLAEPDDYANRLIAATGFLSMSSILIPGITGLVVQRLTLGGTLLQLVFLFILFPYGLPLAVWGLVLLRRSLKEQSEMKQVLHSAGDIASDH